MIVEIDNTSYATEGFKMCLKKLDIICPYCGKEAKLVGGDIVYPHRSDLKSKKFWHCEDCSAYVGTHGNSKKAQPLGRLANKELREWKQKAHSVFDPLWKRKIEKDGCSKTKARKAGYKWLAEQLGVEVKDCHIGMFDVEGCKKVFYLCLPYFKGHSER